MEYSTNIKWPLLSSVALAEKEAKIKKANTFMIHTSCLRQEARIEWSVTESQADGGKLLQHCVKGYTC